MGKFRVKTNPYIEDWMDRRLNFGRHYFKWNLQSIAGITVALVVFPYILFRGITAEMEYKLKNDNGFARMPQHRYLGDGRGIGPDSWERKEKY
ncbi:hypothetical protein FVE85_1050 [Porphyridium purpureum]|uniref:NADH dehydrogenase [ubiquinone] 1 beta subcomplex subunit 4 n=1 Tax=Porphyridium purpureum TaxID=35688 RepID=A0A5J4Z0E1_PORPP|nr:hypothetical protein FVE85_1050 [Porphyridium purpureum]|eukprot:POR8834..scf208_2